MRVRLYKTYLMQFFTFLSSKSSILFHSCYWNNIALVPAYWRKIQFTFDSPVELSTPLPLRDHEDWRFCKTREPTIPVTAFLSGKTLQFLLNKDNYLFKMRVLPSHKKLILVWSLRSVGDIGGKNLLLLGRVVSRAGSLGWRAFSCSPYACHLASSLSWVR